MKQNSISLLSSPRSEYLRVLDVIESLVVVVSTSLMTQYCSNRMTIWIAKIDRIDSSGKK